MKKKRDWATYLEEDFRSVDEHLSGLEDSCDNGQQVLYHIMELEVLLGRLEEKGVATNCEAESMLAADLRDICLVNEPADFSGDQIKCFSGAVRALITGWGKLNDEKTNWICGRLLEVGLTWLPVTKKAAADISEAHKLIE